MTQPNLIHPIDCVIEPIDKANSQRDSQAREPILTIRSGGNKAEANARLPQVEIEAQVSWKQQEFPDPERAGAVLTFDGYILVRHADLATAGWTPKRGDRVVQLGHQTGLNVYLEHFKSMGHYPDQNGAALLKCFWSDKAPAEQATG